MGTAGKKMVSLNLKTLISLLNKALADEWLAFYQYWIGAKMVQGPMSEMVKKELDEHAEEEFKHANMIVERILQLDGTPILNPEEFFKQTNCGYDIPKDYSCQAILKQNIAGEQCAIATYLKLLKFTQNKDTLTHFMVHEILKDEVKHEDDLEKILENMN
ncbi:MAG: ferritin-like domain-containing protein [Parachlamydiales bacterium]|jgi:bacterioferritin